MNLNLKPASECTFDAVSLGEVMLRLDPGEGRIRTARQFRAWEGGYVLSGNEGCSLRTMSPYFFTIRSTFLCDI